MTDALTVQLTFAVNDPELNDEERQEIAQKLLRQLKQLDEVEKVCRAEDSNLEEGSRSVLATLVRVLTLELVIFKMGRMEFASTQTKSAYAD